MTDDKRSSNIPIVDNCDGCSACCMEAAIPPGYSVVILNPDGWPEDTGDRERVANLPEDAMASLLDAMADDLDDGTPCCWLDQSSMRCMYYEHRPNICREFKISSPDCLLWRKKYPQPQPQ